MNPGQSLTAQTLRGVRWTYFGTASNVGLQLIYTAVISRILDPSAFGLVAAAGLALSFATYFAKMGLGQAIVQKAQLSEEEIRASFTSSVLLGGVFSAIVVPAAPIAAEFFREPRLAAVLRGMAVTLLLMGFKATAEGLLRRNLAFQQIAVRTIASYVLGYFCVGLPMALTGAGVWSLVAAAATQVLCEAVLMYLAVRHPVRPIWTWEPYSSLLAFGSRVSVISFFEFIGSNLDTILVGRFTSAGMLGQYNKGYYLVNLPLRHLTVNLSKVLFPSLSSIQTQLERVRRAYMTSLAVAAAIVFPVSAGMAVASRELVFTLLGDQWETTAVILPFFAAAAGLRFMTHFAGIVCEALAVLNRKLLLQVLYVVVLAALMLLARMSGLGVWAYAAALALGELVRQISYVFLLKGVLGVEFRRDVWPAYWPALAAAGVVVAGILGARAGLTALSAPLWLVLAGDIAVAAVLLALTLRYGPLKVILLAVGKQLSHAQALGNGRSRRSRLLHWTLGVRVSTTAERNETVPTSDPAIHRVNNS